MPLFLQLLLLCCFFPLLKIYLKEKRQRRNMSKGFLWFVSLLKTLPYVFLHPATENTTNLTVSYILQNGYGSAEEGEDEEVEASSSSSSSFSFSSSALASNEGAGKQSEHRASSRHAVGSGSAEPKSSQTRQCTPGRRQQNPV